MIRKPTKKELYNELKPYGKLLWKTRGMYYDRKGTTIYYKVRFLHPIVFTMTILQLLAIPIFAMSTDETISSLLSEIKGDLVWWRMSE